MSGEQTLLEAYRSVLIVTETYQAVLDKNRVNGSFLLLSKQKQLITSIIMGLKCKQYKQVIATNYKDFSASNMIQLFTGYCKYMQTGLLVVRMHFILNLNSESQLHEWEFACASLRLRRLKDLLFARFLDFSTSGLARSKACINDSTRRRIRVCIKPSEHLT